MSGLDPTRVPPTLIDAIRGLGSQTERGFTFVRADGTERFCSFRDIGLEAERRAAEFYARGLSKGDRIAIVVPDPEQFVLAFLGAIMGGLVPVPVSPQLSFKNVDNYHDTVTHIVRASGASLLLTTESTRPFVDPVLARTSMAHGMATVEDLAAAGSGSVDVHVDPTDLAFLQFTSGSTSQPKGVMVSHRNLAWNSESFMIHGLKKDSAVDKGVTWLPLFHDMGLIGFVIGTLFTDVPVVFLPTASFVRHPRLWLETIHKHRGTITYAPNFAYALVSKRLKNRDVSDLDLSCLRAAGCGAEPIQAKTLREFAETLAPAKFSAKAFLPSYGMAEATLAISFAPVLGGMHAECVDVSSLARGEATLAQASTDAQETPPTGVQELVNCGRPFPEHEVAIVDATGRLLAERAVGEIITRGPSVSEWYYQ